MKFYKIFLSIYFLITAATFTYAQENNFISYDQPLVGSTLRFKMVPIQGGDFLVGSPENEIGRNKDEGPQKKINHCAFLDECL